MDSPATLDRMTRGTTMRIAAVDWDALAVEEGKRLRALGIDTGAEVTLAHRGVFGTADPLAIRIGRMTIAVRRVHGRAMQVEPV